MYKLIPKIDDEGKGRGGELIMGKFQTLLVYSQHHIRIVLVKNISFLASTSHLIIAAIRNYLRAEKIKAFELLESREDQIKFLLDNKAQIALLQVNYNVIKSNGNDCKIILMKSIMLISSTTYKYSYISRHLPQPQRSIMKM